MSGISPKNQGIAQIVIIIGTIFILASIPLTIFLVKQRQVKTKAEGAANKIICVVGGDGDRYNNDTIRVINNTNSQSTHTVSRRFCTLDPPLPSPTPPYPLASPYTCDSWDDLGAGDRSETVPANSTRTFTISIPNCMVGQLDITNCECFNLDCTQTWNSNLAYTMKVNRTNYIPSNPRGQQCPGPSATPSPTPSRTPTPSPTGVPPTITGTRTPTPSGQPTATRTPTVQPTTTSVQPTTPPAATNPPVVYPSATPVPPVTGNVSTTIFAILGGGVLLLIGLIL